jgi:hypothetical protein
VSRALSAAGRACAVARDRAADGVRVTGFLRGWVEFRSRPDDVYIATYPRSGTTWMQFIVHLLLSGTRFDFRHISEVTPWFERSLALGSRTAADFERLPSPRVFKTHLLPQWLPRSGRVIHVHRGVDAVVRSYYGLYASHLGYRGSFDRFFDRFMRGRVQYGSWFEHRAAWLRTMRPNVVSVTYEDMDRDLGAAVDAVAAFLGCRVTPVQRQEVLRMASRSFMKEHEDRFDPITEHLIDHGFMQDRFIGTGRAEPGLDEAQRARLAAALRAAPRTRWRAMELPAFLH